MAVLVSHSQVLHTKPFHQVAMKFQKAKYSKKKNQANSTMDLDFFNLRHHFALLTS